jgi:DNA-binding CsgD family transcriptional regulator
MNQEIQKLQSVWLDIQKRATVNTILPQLKFDEFTSAILSLGPFYFYIIDFYDMSLSNISSEITEIHGFDPETVSFTNILETIHPDDIEFITRAEASIADFFYNKIGNGKITDFKVNYNFRSRMKNGDYCLLNHQAIMMTLDNKNGFGKSLNIHTKIDHLSKNIIHQYSLININNGVSYMNIDVFGENACFSELSKREIDVIKLIAEGNDNKQIAELLCLSVHTIKTHRKKILQKTKCTNTAQLVKKTILLGLL